MPFTLSLRHVDTCLPCYVNNHCNGDDEALFGVIVDSSSRYHQVKAGLIDQVRADCSEKIPEGISEADILACVNEEFATAHPFKTFDSSLDRASEDGESCYAWFRLSWEEEPDAPGGNGAEIDDASDPMWPIEPGDHDASEGAVSAAYAHPTYNVANFPRFICHHGNWDIYANADGYCVSIPTDQAFANGCKASHFGDAGYVRATLGVDPLAPAMVPQPVQQAQAKAERFTVTYEIVTPESAENGDAAERGYVHANGGKDSLERMADVSEYRMPLSSVRSILGLNGGFHDCGTWFATTWSDTNYQTGAETRYCLHPSRDVTPSSYRRLARLIHASR